MIRDGVEQHREGEDVTRHQEDQEQQLANAEDFASDGAKEQLTRVSHAVNLGIPQLELAHDIARIP